VSASSFAWNANTYQAKAYPAGVPWDMYVWGMGLDDWKSPFDPAAPNTVVGLDGYPAPIDPGDLSLGPPIAFGATYEYEWPMVYEWSVNLTTAGCGSNAVFLVTGQSHHSPMKTGVEGLYEEECGEENDCFPPNGGSDPLSDWGDLPDTYGTLEASSGPRHQITAAGPYLGSALDAETDGNPDVGAAGDDSAGTADEEGVTANVTSDWTVGSAQTFTVISSGTGVLAAWLDWNGDGDFDDANEYVTLNVTAGPNTLNVTVGAGFDWQNDVLHARFRVFSSGASAPGGSLDSGDSIGNATDGEVEDYVFPVGSLPVTLNAFASDFATGAGLTVRWQTASETDNVGFELLGLVEGEWQPLGEFVASKGMNSALPHDYEKVIFLPTGVTLLELVDYDTRGRPERFGPFRPGTAYGEFQPHRRVDWTGPRAQRTKRLERLGFVDTGRAIHKVPEQSSATRWRKLKKSELGRRWSSRVSGSAGRVFEFGEAESLRLEEGSLTHIAVTEPGIQRISYETLREGGLDLAGVRSREIAVTLRGEPVARRIEARGLFGPGSTIEFIGKPPRGDEALYLDAILYQVSVDAERALPARQVGSGKARNISTAYAAASMVDRAALYHRQSPTGDPWVERSVLTRRAPVTVDLEVPVEGTLLSGPGRLIMDLGTITDLPDLTGPSGEVIPEHNVEIWLSGPSSEFVYITSASASGQGIWRIETDIPAGVLQTGTNRLRLRFATDYFYSLVLIDRYGVRYPAAYVAPELDFAADPSADGYRVEGFESPFITAYAEGEDGTLTRIASRVSPSGSGYAAELRQVDDAHYWVAASPHTPAVFTTEAPADLLAGPADLVVIADSSFIGTPALDDYLAQKSAFRPVVIDVEDIYNGLGFGMALPAAITDYLRVRDEVHPFTHVQLVGADCYDRLNRLSDCVSFIPLPTARVGVTFYSPSQNRLVDLDGDGVGDKAVAQFSVRDEAELATIVQKGAEWSASGLSGAESAFFIAEETDGVHRFTSQIDRLKRHLGWREADVLEMADHPDIETARQALRSSLDEGRTMTVFSGHSSPSVWAYRSLLTASGVEALTNVGLPTVMVPLACETTYDISPDADVLGHQLLYAGGQGALAISGAVALSSLDDNERMAAFVLDGLKSGLTLGEAVQAGREALGTTYQTLQDNWMTQGDVAVRIAP
jgi:hypothetical protein